jgi:hypothetical protein
VVLFVAAVAIPVTFTLYHFVILLGLLVTFGRHDIFAVILFTPSLIEVY